MRKLSILLFLCAGLCFTSSAQQPKHKLPADLIQYFTGTWKGAGTFSNGKPIAATATFNMSLDSTWLQYEHTDVPPNQYKAHSVWGVDANGDLLAYIFDNFGGHRQFQGNYSAGGLLLTNIQLNQQGQKVYSHFVYQRLTANTFKMAFEMSQDSLKWRMIDTLIFHKN
ncbi:hypothetical protein ACE38W_13470 [Chitinophaga sp. Hz27]|uniref:hypothetical protein n=1 Tax=Chitinophaga sp. Hz27 TaxID=3347169 RepID=UPI0035E02982